jgi:hypothetical protein
MDRFGEDKSCVLFSFYVLAPKLIWQSVIGEHNHSFFALTECRYSLYLLMSILMLLLKGGPRWRKSRIASDTVLKTLGPHNPKPNMLFFYSKEKRGPKPNLLGLKNYRQSTVVIFLKNLRLLH